MQTKKLQSVLFVDDDRDICEVVTATLCLLADLEVHTVGSGEQAIALALEIQPDLILMDVMMPGLDGPSAFKRMRADPRLVRIPVIFMTAKLLPAEIARFVELGVIGIIGKPFEPLKLGDELLRLWQELPQGPPNGIERRGKTRVQQKVRSLTGDFMERTLGDSNRLRQMIDGARSADVAVFKEIERISHTIHGAGAMFGFPGISEAGAALERAAERATVVSSPHAGSVQAAAALQHLSECCDRLGLALSAAERLEPVEGALFYEGGLGK